LKVILSRDIPKVGKDGEIVNVADGYARNYLFPRQYAVPATGGALRAWEARRRQEQEREARRALEAQAEAEKLANLTLTITARVGGGTKLFGSVTAQDVADAIARERGITVDRRRVSLADPIKNLGTYTVPVRLHTDIVVPITVEVITEEELRRRTTAAEAPADTAQE
jgi:large subunit ribosomal protein L9